MTIAEKILRAKTDYDEVYEAGKSSVIDESKIIEKTAEGTGIVALDDVSSLSHNISVQLMGDNVGRKQIKVYGRNLFANNTSEIKEVTYSGATTTYNRKGYEIHLPNGTYVVHTTLQDGETGGDCIYGQVVDENNRIVSSANTFTETNSHSYTRPVVFDIKDGYMLLIFNGVSETSISATQKIFAKYDIQIECDTKTDFQPYIEPAIYTADETGYIEGIERLSPCLTLLSEGAVITATYFADSNLIEQRQKQWETVATKRNDHEKCFAYAWNDDAFRPTTDLIVKKGSQMFLSSKIANLAGCFKKYHTKLDTSAADTLYYAFYESKIARIPEISVEGIKSTTGTTYMLASANIESVEKIIFKDDGTTPIASNMCANASKLKEIRVGGVIGTDINFSACPLSKDSIDNVLDHLKQFDMTWTETTNTQWEQKADGTYPCDKVKIKFNEIPENVTEYKVVYEVGDDEGNSGRQYAPFNADGTVELSTFYGAEDNSGYLLIYGISLPDGGEDLSLSQVTIYEGTAPTPSHTVTFKRTAVEAAYSGYTSTVWDNKVKEALNKGWTINLA